MDATAAKSKSSNWEKFKLLVWKNWILQWSHKLRLAVHLLLPAFCTLILVLIRISTKVERVDVSTYPPLDISNLKLFRKEVSSTAPVNKLVNKLIYSPTNPLLGAIINEATKSLNLDGYDDVPNSAALEKAFITDNYLAGVQFDNSWDSITVYPHKFAFSLRFPSELRTAERSLDLTWLTSKLFPPKDLPGPRNPKKDDGGLPVGYLREGFLPVQHAVSMAYLKLAGKKSTLPYMDMQRFPYPKYVNDKLSAALDMFLPFIIMLSYFNAFLAIVMNITSEKEKQLKLVMKITGIDDWLHWIAWFVKSLIMLAISSVLNVLLITIKWADDVAVLTFSDWSVLYVFLLIHIINNICFCFLITTFFSRTSTAVAVASTVLPSTYLPALFSKNYEEMSLGWKLCWCLFPNTAMSYGFKEIIGFEGNGEGLQWSNLFRTVTLDTNLTVGVIMLMMLASSVIFIVICLYLEQVMPGPFGVPKKWYFPFTTSFWRGQKNYASIQDTTNSSIEREIPDAFEEEPSGKHVGVQAKNLKKSFDEKYAVKGVSVNMYEGEITVLLGHNGAGKTTVISMLIGMLPPTSGTAIINGSDIRTDTKRAQASLGICPQINILFDDMSVANHIKFFSRLKGLKGDDIKKEVDKYLELLQLEDKANVASKKLSGGMKRKLSLCCALCGGTKVVLCDEPSSGLDPSARRQLWDLLQAEKNGRTVLLTTHFMDEADVLGDRVAIMCDGELKCYGTSFFLKKKYGSGYRLICVKSEGCRAEEVTALLNKYIPGITPEADIGAELSYQLPDSYSATFEEMFIDLEENAKNLLLNGFGVGITSLEEVFMKVGAENLEEGANGESGVNDKDIEAMDSNSMFTENTRLLHGKDLLYNQWRGMLLKKFLCMLRKKMFYLAFIVFGPLLVNSAVNSSHTAATEFQSLPALEISLTQYPQTNTVLETASDVAPGSIEERIATEYKNFASSYGSNHKLQTTGEISFSQYILKLGETMQVRINAHYMAAATVSAKKITAWLNNQPLHTAPLTVNLVHNAMAKVIMGREASITVTNYPLPYSFETKVDNLTASSNVGFFLAVNVGLFMSFLCAYYVFFIINERESRSKLLQFVGGVRVWIFWLSHLLFDMITYLTIVIAIIITLVILQEKGYSNFEDLMRYLFLMVAFGFAVLPFTYCLTFFFRDAQNGFSIVTLINMVTGLFFLIGFLFIPKETGNLKNNLKLFLRVFPHFSLLSGWIDLYNNWVRRDICSSETVQVIPRGKRCEVVPKCCSTIAYFAYEEPGILLDLLYLGGTAVIFFLIINLLDYGIIDALIFRIRMKAFKPPSPPDDGYFDDDVANEKNHILEMSEDQLGHQNLVLINLTKYYGKFVAVNQLYLVVKENECFGLLGVNGAGKTTTFKMMTGDERITYGSAYIKGMSLKTEKSKIYQDIGYCPQFDALIDFLTGRETLHIFCLIRGVRHQRIKHAIEELAKSFGFTKYLDAQTNTYSGGNKRKLSTAIAVIGSPSVIYLDEPTTGLDPAARRQLWNIVIRLRDSGKSIVLTSHSMEECEALCTRLAIMVNGDFKCIGSTQHLKNKFSKGLVLKIKLRHATEAHRQSAESDSLSTPNMKMEQDISAVKEFVDLNFPQSTLREQHQSILTFYIPLSNIKWSRVFGLMERNRESLNIEDYSITQTTLDEIFLEFAKYQREDVRLHK